MTKRFWELDALRGICILGMVVFHLLYDLNITLPLPLQLLQEWGGCVFLLLSGVCVTLGHRPVRRGLVVLGCGMICTLVTWGMYALKLASNGAVIWFGVLHCLGVCMLLWPLFRKIPSDWLGLSGSVLIVLGFLLENLLLNTPFWCPWASVSPALLPPIISRCFPIWDFSCWARWSEACSIAKKKVVFPMFARCAFCAFAVGTLFLFIFCTNRSFMGSY